MASLQGLKQTSAPGLRRKSGCLRHLTSNSFVYFPKVSGESTAPGSAATPMGQGSTAHWGREQSPPLAPGLRGKLGFLPLIFPFMNISFGTVRKWPGQMLATSRVKTVSFPGASGGGKAKFYELNYRHLCSSFHNVEELAWEGRRPHLCHPLFVTRACTTVGSAGQGRASRTRSSAKPATLPRAQGLCHNKRPHTTVRGAERELIEVPGKLFEITLTQTTLNYSGKMCPLCSPQTPGQQRPAGHLWTHSLSLALLLLPETRMSFHRAGQVNGLEWGSRQKGDRRAECRCCNGSSRHPGDTRTTSSLVRRDAKTLLVPGEGRKDWVGCNS